MATDLSPIDPNAQQYAALFDYLNAQLEAMMTGFVADVTGQPAGALRLNRTTKRWETWNDAAGQWEPAIDRYDIDVTRLNGRLASTAAGADTIAQRLSGGRLKAGVPTADDDVLRAFELAQHVLAENPHGMNALKVGLGNVANKRQLDRDQNLADIPDKEAARGPSGLDLGDAALRYVGTQAGRLVLWENVPRPANATTAVTGLARFGTAAEHRNGDSGVAATPAGVRQMGFMQGEHRTSGLISFADATIRRWYHYEGRVPDKAWITLRCIASDKGFDPGMEVDEWRLYDRNVGGTALVVKTSNTIEFICGDSIPCVIWYESTAAADFVEIDRSKWRMIFHGVWFD